MKNELYNAIKTYCEENHCWVAYNTVKEWNKCLGTSYAAGTFTALVSNGLLERTKKYGEKSYSYRLAPTDEVRQKTEETKRQQEIEWAKWNVEHYDENVTRIRARYEEMIRQAEEQLARDLEWEDQKLAEAKALLNSVE